MSINTPHRRITGLLVAALLAMGVTGIVAPGTLVPSAQAATTPAKVVGPGKPADPGFVGYVLAGGGELGIARLPGGTYALGIDSGAGHPWPTGTLTSTEKSHRIIGYLAGQYLPKAIADPYTAAALWWTVGLDEQLNSDPTDANQYVADLKAQDPTAYQKVAADRAAMLADANAHAAPAGGYVPNHPTISYAPGGGTVDGLGFKDRSGNWMSGYAMTVTLTGSAQFTDGTTTATVVSGTQPVSVSWTQTGTSPVTATVSLTGAPADKYTLLTPPSPQERTVTASAPSARSAAATLPNAYFRVALIDTASRAPLAGARFTAWRDDNNDGIEQAGEAPVALTTDSTGNTGLVTALQGEPVCVTETAAPANYRRSTGTSCMTASGTSTAPTVGTLANDRIWTPTVAPSTTPVIKVATQPHASFSVASTGGHPTSMTWTLLGPLAPNPTSGAGTNACAGLTWANAAAFATGTVAVTGDGTYNAMAPALTKAGCYTWTATTVGHSLIRAVATPAGQAGATFAAQAAPGIVGQVNARSARPGSSLSETLTVTGSTGQVVTGTWALRGPMTPPYSGGKYTCTAVNWASAPLAAHGTFTTGKDGSVLVGTKVVRRAGCYTYTASVTGTPTVTAIPETRAGIAADSSRVTAAPTMTGRVSVERTTVGTTTSTTLFDTLTLAGTAGQTVRGTWALFGPLAPRSVSGKATCVGVNWAKARRVATDSFTAVGDGSLGVGGTALTRAGCYTYIENLWASANTYALAATARGVPAATYLLP